MNTQAQGIETRTLDRFIRGATAKGSTKSALSDKALLKQNGAKFVHNSGQCWGNGFIWFFEDTPIVDGYEPTQASTKLFDWSNSILHDDGSNAFSGPVWPITACPNSYGSRRMYAEFSDGNGLNQWYDGRYVSAMLKRCRRAKAKQIAFRLCDMPIGIDGKVLVVYADNVPVGLIMQLNLFEKDIDKMFEQADVVLRFKQSAPLITATELTKPIEPDSTNATTAPLPETSLELPEQTTETTVKTPVEIHHKVKLPRRPTNRPKTRKPTVREMDMIMTDEMGEYLKSW